MPPRFIGKFEASVHKQRIVIPSSMKKKFSPAAKDTIVATIGSNSNHIVIFPMDIWDEYIEKLEQGESRQLEMVDYLYDYAIEQKLEGPGRIKLSDELLELAGITDKAVILGKGNYISVWAPETLDQTIEDRSKRVSFKPGDFRL